MPSLRLVTASFPDDPVLDTAVSRALLERVAAGELPETLRLARPGRAVVFAKRDAVSPGYAAAAAAARALGFEPVLRLAGGRAAVFHEDTVEIAHAVPGREPRIDVHERFEEAAAIVEDALRRLGVDATVGELAGEWCPGGYSVQARGRVKLAGIGQRVIAGGAHVGGVVVVAGEERVRDVLAPVYEELRLEWAATTVGSVRAEAPGTTFEDVVGVLRGAYAERYELVEDEPLDPATLALAERLRDEHLVPRA